MVQQPKESEAPSHTAEQLQAAVAAEVERLWATSTAPGLTRLTGDASSRIYHRLETLEAPPRSLIVMELGPDPLKSDEIAGSEQPAELPFFELQGFLAAGDIAVPQIYAYLRDEGLLLLEDLGDCTLGSHVVDAGEASRWSFYQQAIELLVRMQRYAAGAPRDCICFRRRFDRRLLRWELDHFREWLWEADRRVVSHPEEHQLLETTFDWISDELAALPTIWVHRDYQSRNLMVQTAADGSHRLRVIDFQDALIGPLVYDLVGLLRDSYVDLGLPFVRRCLALYHELAAPPVDREALERMFWLQTVQRKLKDAGRFVYIDRVRGNPSFLRYIPTSLRYVGDALAQLPELQPLRALLARHLPEVAAVAPRS